MDNLLNLPKNRKIILVTHAGSFHADEIFASAVLDIILSENGYEFEIIRTRDANIILNADIVYDVGGIYDYEKLRFDHHQIEGIEKRDGIPYSSFGLIWKHFGLSLCKQNMQIWSEIERRLVLPIDAADSGIETYKNVIPGVKPVMLQDLISTFNETWKEAESENQDELFFECLTIAKKCFARTMTVTVDSVEGATIVADIYEKTINKNLIIIDTPLPWESVLSSKSDTLLVVYPSRSKDKIDWHIKGVGFEPGSFNRKHYFPIEWRGLQGEDLESVTGVPGSMFCHKNGFIFAANSKEAAVKIAETELSKKSL